MASAKAPRQACAQGAACGVGGGVPVFFFPGKKCGVPPPRPPPPLFF